MARSIIALLFLVFAFANDTSLPACTQAGHSLVQSTCGPVATELATIMSNEEAVPILELKGAPVPMTKANGSRLSLLAASMPDLSHRFCRSHPCSLLAAGDKRHGLGATADMDEAGYQEVANLKDDEEMKTFILRVITDYDSEVVDEGRLETIVPWFSGTKAVQTFDKLEEYLLSAVLAHGERWLSYKNTAGITGAGAALDPQGYIGVAVLGKDIEMETFARRLADQMGINVIDEGGFTGMVNQNSEAAAFRSFDKLREEIESAAALPHSWANVRSI